MKDSEMFGGGNLDQVYEELNRVGTQESQGGGALICKALVQIGYKVYASREEAPDQSKTFFGFRLGDEEAKKAAKAEATQFSRGLGKGNSFAVQITLYRESAWNMRQGGPVEWQHDRYFVTDWYTQACKEVVVPSLREAGVSTFPWTGWIQAGFKDDPWKVANGVQDDEAPDGTMRYKQVMYVQQAFADEAEARAFMEGSVAGEKVTVESEWKVQGEGWTDQAFIDAVDEIREARESGKAVKDLAEDYGLTVQDVLYALGVGASTSAPAAVANEYGVGIKDVLAVRSAASNEKPF